MVEIAPEGGRTPRRIVELRVLLGHYGIYALTNLVLLAINLLTTPGNWWFLWVVGGWGMLVAAHAGHFARGWIGAHVLAFVVGGIGLIAIDLRYSDQLWFYWPLLAWGLVLGVHLVLSSRRLRRYYRALEDSFRPEPARREAEQG